MTDLIIGVMTGTSLDGVDVVITSGPDCAQVLHSNHVKLASSLTSALADLSSIDSQNHSLTEIKSLEQLYTQQIADAINQTLVNASLVASDILVAGVHGLTVCHAPNHETPFTWQLLDAHKLAVEIGIDVVYDFRAKDVALGGQGAPLVPPFHNNLFSHLGADVAVLNLGGIANITTWPEELAAGPHLIGFDAGPANTLLDKWISVSQGHSFDKNGEWGASGTLVPGLLTQMMDEPYFELDYPKSTGKELFNLSWLERQLDQYSEAVGKPEKTVEIANEDVQCTLVHLTALTVAQALNALGTFKTLVVCGGGVHNQFLMQLIAEYLPGTSVESSLNFKVCPDNLEALAFAWLAYCRLNNIKSSAPSVTGAKASAVLGAWVRAD